MKKLWTLDLRVFWIQICFAFQEKTTNFDVTAAGRPMQRSSPSSEYRESQCANRTKIWHGCFQRCFHGWRLTHLFCECKKDLQPHVPSRDPCCRSPQLWKYRFCLRSRQRQRPWIKVIWVIAIWRTVFEMQRCKAWIYLCFCSGPFGNWNRETVSRNRLCKSTLLINRTRMLVHTLPEHEVFLDDGR